MLNIIDCIKKTGKHPDSVNNFPSEIQKLTFDQNFNQHIDNLIIGLKNLKFGDGFNKSVLIAVLQK